MGVVKAADFWLNNNIRVSRLLASRALFKGGAKWAAWGAGLGAVRGLSDNVIGEDRVSVLGGAIQGALWGITAKGALGIGAASRMSKRMGKWGKAARNVLGAGPAGTRSARMANEVLGAAARGRPA